MKNRLLLPLALLTIVTAPLFAGPPWISVEVPANPFDQSSRNAFLLVHAFHYARENGAPITGRAIGTVNGQRRTMALTFEATSRSGVYALKNAWGNQGEWALVITNHQGEHAGGTAEVMVRVSGNRVVGIEAATKSSQYAELPFEPRRFTDAEIDASLKGTLK